MQNLANCEYLHIESRKFGLRVVVEILEENFGKLILNACGKKSIRLSEKSVKCQKFKSLSSL